MLTGPAGGGNGRRSCFRPPCYARIGPSRNRALEAAVETRSGIEKAKRADGPAREAARPADGKRTQTPATGPAAQLLLLQRQAGNRAVAGLVQRKIGFEIETRIPIAEKRKIGEPSRHRHRQVEFHDVRHDEFSAPLSAVGSDLTVDHDDKTGDPTKGEKFEHVPIIEFVTRPVDEAISVADFKKDHATKWVDYLKTGLYDKVPGLQDQDVKGPVPSAVTKPGQTIVIGLPEHGRDGRATIQSTVGLPLSRVQTLLAHHAHTTRGTTLTKPDWRNPAKQVLAAGDLSLHHASSTEGLTNVENLLRALMFVDEQERSRATQSGIAPPPFNIEAIRGLLLLISQGLVAQRVAARYAGGYFRKNRPALFAKSELSAVRNAMVSGGGYAALLLRPQANPSFKLLAGGREWLIAKLLDVNGWKQGDVLDHGSKDEGGDLLVDDWLKDVLDGKADKMFQRAKNPWSSAIKPETTGAGEVAPVVELRHLSEILSVRQGSAGLDLTTPDTIVNRLVAVFQLYKLSISK